MSPVRIFYPLVVRSVVLVICPWRLRLLTSRGGAVCSPGRLAWSSDAPRALPRARARPLPDIFI